MSRTGQIVRHRTATANTVQRAAATARENREEAHRLLAFVNDRMGDVAGAFYDIGEALAKLRAPALYTALGHDSFDALLEAIHFSKAQAYRFIGIAQKLTRDRAAELGPRRSVALLRLASATPGDDSVAEVLRKGVTLPGRKGPLPVNKLTVEQLEDVARAIARAHRPVAQRVPATEHDAAVAAAAALRERLHEAGHSSARVSVHRRSRRDQREALLLRIELPYAALDALAASLPRRKK